MQTEEIRAQWEGAAPGWARWEDTIASAVEPATDAMLEMAAIAPGYRVLDLACGAGSQTLATARRAGPQGQVLASDISATMLEHVRDRAGAAGLDNVSTMVGAAEELDLPPDSFDAVICRFGLMLFADPAKALSVARHALKPGGKLSVVVFSVPDGNPFVARPMQILMRHAGKTPPAPGQPGLFALGAPNVLGGMLSASGFGAVASRIVKLTLRVASVAQALSMMQEAFGAYRAVLSDCSEQVRQAAWAEVAEALEAFVTDTGFEGPLEALVVSAAKLP